MTDRDKKADSIRKDTLDKTTMIGKEEKKTKYGKRVRLENQEESLEEQLAKIPLENSSEDAEFDEDEFEEHDLSEDEDAFEEHDLSEDEDAFEEQDLSEDEEDFEESDRDSRLHDRYEGHKFYGEDDFDDRDEDDEPERPKKKKRGKKALIVIGCILAFLIVVYLGIAMFFNSHFLYATKINGVDFSFKTVEQVESYMKEQVANYSLTLEESDGSEEVIKGSDIGIEYVAGDELLQLVKGQQKFLWIKSLWEPEEITAKVGVKYDEDSLKEVLKNLNCMDEKKQIASENAYPKFKDTKFEIVPEVVGTKLDEEAFTATVEDAINGFQERVNLEEKDCYILPKYVSDSEEVIEAAEKMNSYLGAQITYEFGSKTEVVDSAQIAKWVKVNKKNMKVSFKKEKVKEYIQKLASKYNTRYNAKKFTTARGNTVTVEGGAYGWLINQDGEYEQLLKDIKKGKAVSREPKYTSRAASHDGAGVGDTYAEVDLTNQHMYFIKNGKVVLESDVVTGNPNKGNATPQGIYTLTYKDLDATLRGQKKADGTYEYETPVKYWMPFNGGIGFHDATWQSSFGGDRYKTHGSHGCVNMPKEKAGELYKLIEAGTPVVCYF